MGKFSKFQGGLREDILENEDIFIDDPAPPTKPTFKNAEAIAPPHNTAASRPVPDPVRKIVDYEELRRQGERLAYVRDRESAEQKYFNRREPRESEPFVGFPDKGAWYDPPEREIDGTIIVKEAPEAAKWVKVGGSWKFTSDKRREEVRSLKSAEEDEEVPIWVDSREKVPFWVEGYELTEWWHGLYYGHEDHRYV